MSMPPTSERRKTLAIFGIASGLCATLLFLRVLPLRRETAALREQLLALDQELAPYQSRNALDPLPDQLRRQQMVGRRLQQEFVRLMALRDTFQGSSPFEQVLPSPEEGRIDFKVALFNARNVLLARTQEQGIQIPPGLGMEESIGTDELAETRLWQLAAIVQLVEHAIAVGIPRIEHIQPLPPVSYPGRLPDGLGLREYPIRMVFSGTFPNLLQFLDRIQMPEHLFAIRNFRVESLSTGDPLRLRTEIVCCAGLLRTEPLPRTEPPPDAATDEETEVIPDAIPDAFGPETEVSP